MGSAGPREPEELKVLVTGFGPFKEQFPQNPSWEIAATLPAYLPAIVPKSRAHAAAAAAHDTAHQVPLPPVRIHVHPQPVRVNYTVVRELVPRLWAGQDGKVVPTDHDSTTTATATATPSTDAPRPNHYDFALHIGMAGPRPEYHLEHRGHRDGYVLRDVDGEVLGDEERHRDQGDRWIWHGLPTELETDFDVEDVLKRWKRYSPDDAALSVSEDAGRYLCDFIYYSSLAYLKRADAPRRVVFLHVPSTCNDSTVARGRDVVLQLIRALAESLQSGAHSGISGDGVQFQARSVEPAHVS